MKLKQHVKSNGKADTIKEVYGAKITLPQTSSISAAPIRSRGRRLQPATPKPPRKYDIDDLIAMKYRIHGTTNQRVVGYEWGGDNSKIRRDCWQYYVKPEGIEIYEAELVSEEDVSGIISD